MWITIVAMASTFSFLSVFWWSLQRRREREAYYRYELARRMLEKSESPEGPLLAWVREVEAEENRRRREGQLATALIAIGAGCGAWASYELYGAGGTPAGVCVGVGVALLLHFVLTWKRAVPIAMAMLLAMNAFASDDIDRIANEEMQRLKLPGLQIAIAKNGKLVYSRGFGLADLEQRVAVTPDTRFRTASVAKSLTATGVMLLAAEGKLDLDAPIATYCPAFAHPVTARQLLSHTSGVRHYARRGESRGTEHYFTIEDSLKLFKDDPLLFEPGTKLGYSTYGYSVLGCAIEGVSKQPYDAFMRTRVFEPFGMRNTAADHHFTITPNRARQYSVIAENDLRGLPPAVRKQVKAGDVVHAYFHDTSMKRPGGGLVSTAEDLVRFAIAFQKNEALRGLMWTIAKTADGREVVSQWGPFGLGWFVRQRGERTEIYTSGGQIGGRASMYVYPAEGIVLAVMTNVTNAPIIAMEERILRVLMPDLAELPKYEAAAIVE
jgi:CubicO group peptidase (beta-lactamase class C family)